MVVLLSKLGALPRLVPSRALKTSASAQHGMAEWWWGPEKNNGREVVGTTIHGDEFYDDRIDFWYPAVRFRKNDALIRPIREKELGDWKNLTKEEMKLLYRYSFRQTLAEFENSNPHDKLVPIVLFAVLGCALLYASFLKAYVFTTLPLTFDEEYKESMLEKRLVMEKDTVIGINRDYDYEKNRWKN